MAPIVVVTGAESTGKSSLAGQLARRFAAPLVPEFARAYAERVQRPLIASDVAPIARGQVALEDAAIATAPGLLVLDTDLLSTLVYARHFYGAAMPGLESLVRGREPALYLFCDIDVPWVHDPVRDAGDARLALHERFAAQLSAQPVRTVRVFGTWEERWATAERAVLSLMR